MSIGHSLTAAATTLLEGARPAAPDATQVLAQLTDVGAYALTTGRIWGTAAALLGLVGVVLGGWALARARRRGGNGGTRRAIVTLVAGLIAVAGGTVTLAVADGGPGTGNGVVGGALALLLGLLAVALAGMAAARSRHTG